MLRSTFAHLPGVGFKTERTLWDAGIRTWDDIAQSSGIARLRHSTLAAIDESIRALEAHDANWFAERLPRREHWRIALEYPNETLFVDIETTGLSRYYHEITVIGWTLDGSYDAVVTGERLDRFVAAVGRSRAMVTFNGSLFDCPFLLAEIPRLRLPRAHVDLRFTSRRLGLSGGQKAIEASLGIRRRRSLADVDGRMAADLWRMYQRGSTDSLELLLQYNAADVIGMEEIFGRFVRDLARAGGAPRAVRPSLKAWRSVATRPSSTVSSRVARVGPWHGAVGPKLTYAGAVEGSYRAETPIVGVDLSGSEGRASGWAVVAGRRAECQRVRTDADILRLTQEADPSLVSIDAPLSLPRGRLRPDDSDPTRIEFGIMRECERVLKRRGVNVYPALIRSMQSLTERGIRLAASLRERGIPVIESFPGAMQDVLGIPRKRDSMIWLRQGLREYGLVGSFSDQVVSHDELDALSAAVVGQLTLAGHVESLGNDEEGYLMVPDLRKREPCALVVGLSGPPASGKTTLANGVASTLGLEIVSTRSIVAAIAGAAKVDTRAELQTLGAELRRTGRQIELLREVALRVLASPRAVVDAMRFLQDRAFLAERYGRGFVHVHVASREEVRRARFISRGGTDQEFTEAEKSSLEQAVPELTQLADLRLANSADDREEFVKFSSARLFELLESRGLSKCLSR